MWQSLRVRLTLIFLGFLLLVVGSVGTTFGLVRTQQDDATVINLAGRQRMLTQQITRLVLTDPQSSILSKTVVQFGQILQALRTGGMVTDGNGREIILSAATDAGTLQQLNQVTMAWQQFQLVLTPPLDEAVLQTQTTLLLTELERLVIAYEKQAQAKLNQLKQIQGLFLLTVLGLLVWQYLVLHRQVIQPLLLLNRASQQISAGNVRQPIPPLPPNELGKLGQTFGQMRAEIATAQTLLEQRVHQRTQELATAFEFSQEIVRQLESNQLLQSVVQHIGDLTQAEASSVCLLNGDGQKLELVAGSGVGYKFLGLQQSIADGLALPVIQHHQTVITTGGCANCAFLHHFSGSSCMATPLRIGNQTLGALCVVRSARPFDREEAQSLTLLANAAAIALENSRLIDAGKEQAKQNAVLTERERLAAELHDNLAQTLGVINLNVDLLTKEWVTAPPVRLKDIQSYVQKAYTQVRLALTGLRETDTSLSQEWLQELQKCVLEFQAQTGLEVEMKLPKERLGELPALTQKQILHITRESLTNIRRHAQATSVQLQLISHPHQIELTIADNGIGFDPHQNFNTHHLGINIMHTRAERVGGKLTIQSQLGKGTQVTATFARQTA